MKKIRLALLALIAFCATALNAALPANSVTAICTILPQESSLVMA